MTKTALALLLTLAVAAPAEYIAYNLGYSAGQSSQLDYWSQPGQARITIESGSVTFCALGPGGPTVDWHMAHHAEISNLDLRCGDQSAFIRNRNNDRML